MSFPGMLNNDYKSRIDTPEILQRLKGALLTLPDITPDRQELHSAGPKGGQFVRRFILIFLRMPSAGSLFSWCEVLGRGLVCSTLSFSSL